MLDKEQSTWFTRLLYIELVIKTTVNISIGKILFMLVHIPEVKLPIGLALGTSGKLHSQKYAHKVTELVEQACNMMSKAQYA